MTQKKRYWGRSLASFLFVLFTMPLGHAVMKIMEHTIAPATLPVVAFIVGFVGFIMVIAGVFVKGDLRQTLLGFFGALLFWTGWVEFLFQYYVDRFGMQPLTDPATGKVTQPEYLVLPATFGLLMMFYLLYIFSTRTGCYFFNWIQKKTLGRRRDIVVARPMTRHVAIVTFMELNVMLWTSYVVLMFCYDTNFLGDTHPVTLALAVVCLVGSVMMFIRQTRLESWGANIRMSIATVVVFWTFVEILGHIGLFKEIWVAPMDHVVEMCVLGILFLGLAAYTVIVAVRK